jgi:hypothetical protein
MLSPAMIELGHKNGLSPIARKTNLCHLGKIQNWNFSSDIFLDPA